MYQEKKNNLVVRFIFSLVLSSTPITYKLVTQNHFNIYDFMLVFILLPFIMTIILQGRRKIELHDNQIVYQDRFRQYSWDYNNIERICNKSFNRHGAVVYYLELTSFHDQKMRIPWLIFQNKQERQQFIYILKEKNPLIRLDYDCSKMLYAYDNSKCLENKHIA